MQLSPIKVARAYLSRTARSPETESLTAQTKRLLDLWWDLKDPLWATARTFQGFTRKGLPPGIWKKVREAAGALLPALKFTFEDSIQAERLKKYMRRVSNLRKMLLPYTKINSNEDLAELFEKQSSRSKSSATKIGEYMEDVIGILKTFDSEPLGGFRVGGMNVELIQQGARPFTSDEIGKIKAVLAETESFLKKRGLGDLTKNLQVIAYPTARIPGRRAALAWYNPSKDMIAMATGSNVFEKNSVRSMVKTMVHELGHRAYFRIIGNKGRSAWADYFKSGQRAPNVDAMIKEWESWVSQGTDQKDKKRRRHFMHWYQHLLRSGDRQKAGEVLMAIKSLDLDKGEKFDKYRGLPTSTSKPALDEFKKRKDDVMVFGEAVTPYSATNPEELFAEAFAHYINLGPRTLSPGLRDQFRRSLPKMKVGGGPPKDLGGKAAVKWDKGIMGDGTVDELIAQAKSKKKTPGGLGSAIRWITGYLNRAGKNAGNRKNLEAARSKLQKMNEKAKKSKTAARPIRLPKREIKALAKNYRKYGSVANAMRKIGFDVMRHTPPGTHPGNHYLVVNPRVLQIKDTPVGGESRSRMAASTKAATSRVASGYRTASRIEAPPAMAKEATKWVQQVFAGEALYQIRKAREEAHRELSDIEDGTSRMTQGPYAASPDEAKRLVKEKLGEFDRVERKAKRLGGKPPSRLPKDYILKVPLDLRGWRHRDLVESGIAARRERGDSLWIFDKLLDPVEVVIYRDRGKPAALASYRSGQVTFWEIPTHLFREAVFDAYMRRVPLAVRHEFQHLAQDMMREATQAESAGLPAGSKGRNPDGVMTPRTKFEIGTAHALRDIEFYTRLQDDIDTFKEEVGKVDDLNRAVRIWTGGVRAQRVEGVSLSPSEFFMALKKHDRRKYRKAVGEFWAAVSERGAPSYRFAARPIRLPKREIKALAKNLALQLFRLGLPKPGRVIAQEHLTLPNVKGGEVEVEILLTGTPGRNKDPFSQELLNGAFLKRRPQGPVVRVFVNPHLDRRSFEMRPRRVVEDELYTLLAHELTHAADIWKGKGSVGDLSGSKDALKKHHHNHPAEVKALMRDVVSHLEDGNLVHELMGYGMNFNKALREALKDTKWPDIEPYLNPRNKKTILKGVYTFLQDQGLDGVPR